jgi:hypothetical protein
MIAARIEALVRRTVIRAVARQTGARSTMRSV